MTISTTNLGSKVGRARRRFSQLWQVPAFLFGVLAFLSVAASAPWRHPPQWYEFDRDLQRLRLGLEQNASGDSLVSLVEDRIQSELVRFPDRAAEAQFLIGSAYYRQARQKPAAYAREVWPRAVEYLEKAHEPSLADTDRLALKYRLGFCLYQLKKDPARAIELMMLAVEKGAEQPLEGYRLLVDANLGLKTPNVESALSASQRILDLTPERDVDATALARLQHAELLLRKQSRSEAFSQLERIGPKAPRGLRIKARLLQARACEEDGQWQKAIGIWQDLLGDSAHVEGGRAKIHYAMGWCYHHMDPPKNAETIQVWAEALKLGGPEGQAAGLHLGDLRLSMGEKHAAQALADWKQALANVNSPKDFNNPHFKLTDVCKLFDHALQRFDQAQDPEKTQQVAELYRKLAPGGEVDKRRAKAAEELAELLLDKHNRMVGKVLIETVHAQFRRAGEAYELAARALPDEQRPEALWRSAQCYLSAKDAPMALKLLTEHVTLEKTEARLAEARFTLGDIYRSQGDKTQAREAFIKCIEIPDTPFASRSRYFLALDEIDKKALDNAYVILKQNLQDDNPSFDRPAHEKSLYKMAWLVVQMKKFEEASIYLKECQRLYPENPNVSLACEQLGECYRQLAKKELQQERDLLIEMRSAELSEDRRQALEENVRARKQARFRYLTSALKTYQGLADELARELARLKKLPPQDEVLLRRAWIGIGECQAEGDDFIEAANTFQQVQMKNRRTVESFYAGLRLADMAELVQATERPKKQIDEARDKAQEALRQLTEDLQGVPAEHELFKGRDAYPREQWLRWLESAQRRLFAPAKKENPLPAIR